MRAATLGQAGAPAWWRATAIAAAPVAALVLAALALRLIVLAQLGSPIIDMDGANFARTAENLVHGYGYLGIRGTVSAVHISLFPLAVALMVWLGAHAEQAAIAISLAAGALLVVPAYDITRQLAGPRSAIVAGAIVAINPIAIAASIVPLADAPALTLAFAGFAAFLRSRESVGWALGAGALFGLAYCTRSEEIAYAAVAVLAACATLLRRKVPLRAGVVRLVALTMAFAVFAVPYVVTISRATGHLRIDTKSAVNFSIGSRIAQGMSYEEAADGLGPNLREVGAELGEGFYITHPGIADPAPGARLAFAAHAAGPQGMRLVRAFASLQFGTLAFVAFALAGLIRGLRKPAVREVYLMLAAICAIDVAALLTLQQLWSRYITVFVPVFAIFAAEPLVALWSAAARRWSAPLRWSAVAVLTIGLCGYLGIAAKRLAAETTDATLAQRAGLWLDSDAPGPKLIVAVGNEIAFYAHGDWLPLPYASSADALAYLHRKRPTYVVLEAARTATRPYLAEWLQDGIPDPSARLVAQLDPGSLSALKIYAWRAP
jgi:hypothetical protein